MPILIFAATTIVVLLNPVPAGSPVPNWYRIELAKTAGNYAGDKIDNVTKDASGRISFDVDESVFKFYRIRGVQVVTGGGLDIGFKGPERSTVNFPVAPTDAERQAN